MKERTIVQRRSIQEVEDLEVGLGLGKEEGDEVSKTRTGRGARSGVCSLKRSLVGRDPKGSKAHKESQQSTQHPSDFTLLRLLHPVLNWRVDSVDSCRVEKLSMSRFSEDGGVGYVELEAAKEENERSSVR